MQAEILVENCSGIPSPHRRVDWKRTHVILTASAVFRGIPMRASPPVTLWPYVAVDKTRPRLFSTTQFLFYFIFLVKAWQKQVFNVWGKSARIIIWSFWNLSTRVNRFYRHTVSWPNHIQYVGSIWAEDHVNDLCGAGYGSWANSTILLFDSLTIIFITENRLLWRPKLWLLHLKID